MGDGFQEDWAAYLRRMTTRPGWSVARLARESHIHRGTIFKWMKGESGVTVASVRAIARALGDDMSSALAAAGTATAEPVHELDQEIAMVRNDDRLDDEMKMQIIGIILERRQREKAASMEETQKLIELFRRRGA